MLEIRKNKIKKLVLGVCLFLSFFFVSFSVFVIIIFNSYDLDINKLTSLNNGIKVYSASGVETTLYNTNRSIVEIETLPEYVIKAFVDVEDKRFYSHGGFDLIRIVKAGLVNLTTNSKSQGASTISQQLIKNALLTNEKTYSRKIKEIVLAIKMEKKFSKNEILEMYLNTIYFGSNAYGIENASKTYFNKSAKDLTLNEACCLAGMIKSPAKYSPKTNYNNAIKRRNLVATTLFKEKSISDSEYYDILNEDIKISKQNNLDFSYEQEAIFEACNLLNITERELINRRYEIITNKNDEVQKMVLEINNNIITSAEERTNSNLDSLSVVTDNSGKIIAYYANSAYNLHNMKRQPASLLKPLAVYLPCLMHNILSPATQILDEPIDYNGFKPNNADNNFHGYVSARDALSKSLNIPAIKALEYVGLDKSKKVLQDLGINISNNDLNLSLALGSIEKGISPLELLSSYSTIANLGKMYNLSFINKIKDDKGKIIYENSNYNEQVLSAEDCYLLTDMLKTAAKTGTAKRLSSLNLPVASKTGTAAVDGNNTDLYNVAYTPQHCMLTWVANIENKVIDSTLHSSVEPTEINKQILNKLYPSSISDFVMPKGVEKMQYDALEAKNNHRIVKPFTDKERFISYDYFKVTNPPNVVEMDEDLTMQAKLSKSGTIIEFKAVKYKEYSVYRETNNKPYKMATIKEKDGVVQFVDNNIFNFDTISYYFIDENDKKSNVVTVKPKDFLINTLNAEILNGKKWWAV